jgi:hypothetical protein
MIVKKPLESFGALKALKARLHNPDFAVRKRILTHSQEDNYI